MQFYVLWKYEVAFFWALWQRKWGFQLKERISDELLICLNSTLCLLNSDMISYNNGVDQYCRCHIWTGRSDLIMQSVEIENNNPHEQHMKFSTKMSWGGMKGMAIYLLKSGREGDWSLNNYFSWDDFISIWVIIAIYRSLDTKLSLISKLLVYSRKYINQLTERCSFQWQKLFQSLQYNH